MPTYVSARRKSPRADKAVTDAWNRETNALWFQDLQILDEIWPILLSRTPWISMAQPAQAYNQLMRFAARHPHMTHSQQAQDNRLSLPCASSACLFDHKALLGLLSVGAWVCAWMRLDAPDWRPTYIWLPLA